MADYYYLVSSLPLLNMDSVPDRTPAEFTAECRRWLTPEQQQLIGGLALVPDAVDQNTNKTLRDWKVWEICLRNAIIRHRQGCPGSTDDFTREEKDYFSEIDKGVQEAFAKGTPLDREDKIDQMRWCKLDELESGHDFDFEKLFIYKLKLLICEKRKSRDSVRGEEVFAETVERIISKDGETALSDG